MRFHEFNQQLDEAPRSRFKQALRGFASRVFSKIPGGRAKALNWAARADLDATINNTYEEFSQFLGMRDKSYRQATGEDLKDFFKKKGVSFSNEGEIPSGVIPPKEMDQWITRVVFEAVTGIKDRAVSTGSEKEVEKAAGNLFGTPMDISGKGQGSKEEPSPEEPSDDFDIQDEPEDVETPSEVREVPALAQHVGAQTDDGSYVYRDGTWVTVPGEEEVPAESLPPDAVDIINGIASAGSPEDLPAGTLVYTSSGKKIEWDGSSWTSGGKTIGDKDYQVLMSHILGSESEESSDDAGPMESVVIEGSDGNRYYWAGAQWINVENNRMAKRDISRELTANVPDRVESSDDLPRGLQVRMDDGTVYEWRGAQWINPSNNRIAKKSVQREIYDKVLMQSEGE